MLKDIQATDEANIITKHCKRKTASNERNVSAAREQTTAVKRHEDITVLDFADSASYSFH
jgi:hypothetical protein